MSYSGKLHLKLEAQELRKKGFSVRHIQKNLKFHDLQLVYGFEE